MINRNTKKSNILYVGNFLAKHGYYPNQASILVKILKDRGWNIIYSSSIKNKLFRFFFCNL